MERYRHYKRLLHANSAILAILADLQTKRNEGYLFDMSYVRGAVDRLSREVEILVEALIALAGGRYRGLEAARQRITARLKAELATPELKPGPLTLPLSQAVDQHYFGGKAAKLGELLGQGFPVPRGFAVSAYAQKLFFEEAGLEAFIREAISKANIRQLDSLRQAGEAIKRRLLASPLPQALAEALAQEMDRLGVDRVSVRSSALQEDGLISFAGQFESILNVPADMVAERYKQVIASQFTPQALYYCHASGYSYQELAMGVLVMEMVNARAAGVLYTADPRTGEDVVIINAVWGLGSTAVGGQAEPDVYRVEKGRLVSQDIGAKTRIHRLAPTGGILEEYAVAELAGPCLTPEQAMELARVAEAVARHFGVPQDIEWALDQAGKLVILQARPLRLSRKAKAGYVPPRLKGVPVLLENGVIASRGAGAGPVHILRDQDIQEIPAGSVLVIRQALPEYGLAVGRVAAVICEMGSATTHLATVLREAGVPALFGAKDAASRLHQGDLVTVDAYYGNVYAGRQEELLVAPPEDAILHQSRAWRTLERALKHITPLNLLDPRSERFRPEACETYHDITRFAHEKAMTELFKVSRGAMSREYARSLQSDLPLEIYVIDVGGGLRPEARESPIITPEDLRSRPMLAYWRGVAAIGWKGPKPLDLTSFISVVMGAASDAGAQDRLQEDNFAIIARDYMNFSSRLGYHFTTIDAYLGAPEESYVTLVFYGGGADLTRRARRVLFLAKVLQHLDFRVELKGDSITARLDGFPVHVLEEKLEVLGRLIMVSKQLDVTMQDDAMVEQYYHEFITSGYNLNI
ncbi:MAG: PEP/pyruvate-binding domain-containing protein [Deltaproteobacteria bacterium]|nr:PEP/pyruvate-binding domain-containing protein [Deltaproteobacteria bacterium]